MVDALDFKSKCQSMLWVTSPPKRWVDVGKLLARTATRYPKQADPIARRLRVDAEPEQAGIEAFFQPLKVLERAQEAVALVRLGDRAPPR